MENRLGWHGWPVGHTGLTLHWADVCWSGMSEELKQPHGWRCWARPEELPVRSGGMTETAARCECCEEEIERFEFKCMHGDIRGAGQEGEGFFPDSSVDSGPDPRTFDSFRERFPEDVNCCMTGRIRTGSIRAEETELQDSQGWEGCSRW